MTPEQARATLTLLGYVPVNGHGMWHSQRMVALYVGQSGIQGSRHVYCVIRGSSGMKVLPEAASFPGLVLVWLAQAAMQDLEPGEFFIPQQVIRRSR